MIKGIIIGVISTGITAIISFCISRIVFGYKHFGGLKNTVRLIKDALSAGVINIFPDRKAYINHKDHGKCQEYILKANHSVLYVGYWLATGTEIGELTKTIKELVNNQVTVTLVFLSPVDQDVLRVCSQYIGVKESQIAVRIKNVIKTLLEFKQSLDVEEKNYLTIKIHNAPISSTAILLDHSKDECRVLVDYKIYNGNRENSYGIEYNNSSKCITNKIMQSFLNISKTAKIINNYEELFE